MKFLKIKNIVLFSSAAILLVASVGTVFASWSVTDNADPFGAKISVEVPHKDAGYYLKWNDDEEIKLGDKVDTELKTKVTVSDVGTQTFEIVDEKNAQIDSGTIDLGMEGEFTFCFKNGSTYESGKGPTEHTYLYYTLYFTNNYDWDNVKAYLFNGNTNNEWPGKKDYSIEIVKQDEYGDDVYKITPNAYLYGNTGSMLVLNNNDDGHQTVDINICETIVPSTTGLYLNDSTINITLNTDKYDWWGPNCTPFAYFFGGDGPNKWEKMQIVSGTNNLIVSAVDLSKYTKVIFGRTSNSGTSGTGWPSGTTYNQTINIDLPFCSKSTFTLNNKSGGDDSYDGNWGTQYHNFGTYSFE